MTTLPRVILRNWRESDRAPFAAMNADPEVMHHFPAPLSRTESDALMDRFLAHHATYGFGARAVEAEGELAGLCGLFHVSFEASFTPAVEIAWRFRPDFQGRGLATEAARLALAEGFGALGLDRIVAFTAPVNERSWRMMERLGMRRAGCFGHPRLPPDHRLHRHVWYSLERADWLANTVPV
ncbi:GNAT family N-acetyltransferase [Roseomonas harenae]|uniref:GNAT family N-acetyltransferase n=1 Tax=Muricoccus harenae TaxID=2692566 RepID=UPI0013312F8F|nr:GNAT family N-acetyltransferase [Roseomonas harenae]